jgi:hypothetical protein
MTNTDHDNNAILEEIVNSIATVYKWKDYYLPEIKKAINIETSVLEKYAGKYATEGKTITFKISDTGLFVNLSGDFYWKVYFTSESEFFTKEFRGFFRFLTDKDMKILGFLFNGKTAKKIE